jgi:hypothetical protein
MYEMEGPRTFSMHRPLIAQLPCVPRTGPGPALPGHWLPNCPAVRLPVRSSCTGC